VAGVDHDGADIVEHGAEDLLEMFGAFREVSGIGDVKDAVRLQHCQEFDQAGVRLLGSGECRGGASAWRAVRARRKISSRQRSPRLVFSGAADHTYRNTI
jgi:hypothetical protein